MRPHSRVLAAGALAAALVVASAWLGDRASRETSPRPRPAEAAAPLPGPADEPAREYDANHQIARIRHKNVKGLSPLEKVNTPDGVVTVQRTFTDDGVVLKEEAFLNGKPVPVPTQGVSGK